MRLTRGLATLALLTAAAPVPTSQIPGFDVAGMDRAVAPGDDFYRYANGRWVDSAVIPPDRAGYSTAAAASERVQQRLKDILEAASRETGTADGERTMLGAFYRASLDKAALDALGLQPVVPHLARIRAAQDLDEIVHLMGSSNATFYGSPLAIAIDVDAARPTRHAVVLRQAGLGLPDRSYYVDPRFVEVRTAYERYVAKLLALAGWTDAAASAERIVALETRIAAVTRDRTAARDPVTSYNPMSVKALAAAAPGFPLRSFLAGAGIKKDRLIVGEREAVPAIARIVVAEAPETLRAWLAFSVLDNAAPYLGRQVRDPWFAFRRATLLGQAEPGPRWKEALRIVGGGDIFSPDRSDHFGNMGWALGRLYVERWFPEAHRRAVDAIAADVRRAMAQRLAENDWLDPASKAEALRKLSSYRFKMGYPKRWPSYRGVRIDARDLAGNVLRLAGREWARERDKLRQPVDRDEWKMTPQTVNAYHGQMNDLVFPAAVLAASYAPDGDDAVNYGAVGTIVGHELTHGFDDWGRNFDARGALRNWWSKADAAAFEARAARLADQFSRFEPLPRKFVDGRLTLGENIADLGGLALAVDAWRLRSGGRAAHPVDGMTGEQRVFLGWAQYLRGKSREAALLRQLVADPHAPRQYRLNGPVRNMAVWYEAFAVRPGAALYLAPDARVRIW